MGGILRIAVGMVDVHILTLPSTNKKWFAECVRSLVGEPVNKFFCSGIVGDISAARTGAYKKGTAKYVSFVDHDDMVIPGVFAKLVALLESNPDAVVAYSDEILIDKDGTYLLPGWSRNQEPFAEYDLRPHCINGQHIHHLQVMRRDAVEKCLPLKTKMMPEPCLLYDLSKLGKFVHLEEVGYLWRTHGDNTFTKYTKEDIEECLSYR